MKAVPNVIDNLFCTPLIFKNPVKTDFDKLYTVYNSWYQKKGFNRIMFKMIGISYSLST